MNCRTCQYELSQCLDGRLPSGRRAIVMEHAESCEPCSRFWDDLQHAQQLVLRLRSHPVSSGFREQLFERVAAGEGTPPAVFHEPIPLATKVRYVLTGAAAAAAVLLVFGLVRGKTTPTGAPVALASTPVDSLPVGFSPSATQPDPMPAAGALLSGVKPLTTTTLAVETAKYFKERFDNANRNLARLETAWTDESAVHQMVESAVQLQEAGELLLDLHEHQQIFFTTPDVPVELGMVVINFRPERLRSRTVDLRRDVAPVLRGLRHLGGIDNQIKLKMMVEPEGQEWMVQRLSLRHSGLFQQMFVDLPSMNGGFGSLDPRQFGRTFVFSSDCGPTYVLIRRSR